MKKLPEPSNVEAQNLLQTVIDNKQKEEYKICLKENQPYVISRYAIYGENKKELKNIGDSQILKQIIKDSLHTSFNSTFKKKVKGEILKDVYEQCKRICPYCGEGRIEEIDHYIPKESYAEFTLYPGNLVPMCSKCNKKKFSKFINENTEREFINYYYDEIDDLNFLRIKLEFEPSNIKNNTVVKYFLDTSSIIDRKMQTIIENHFKNLDLLNRYMEFATEEISNLQDILSNQPCKDADKLKIIAAGIILGNRNTQKEKFGNNDWKFLLYNEIISGCYLDLLVDYAMTV